MNYIRSAVWLFLSAGWLSGVSVIAKAIGGYQWIEHTGQSRTVAMLVAAFRNRRAPSALIIAVAVVVGVHLINAIGMYILYSSNGRAGPILLPFMLLSAWIPTSTQFIGFPPSNASFLILPVATLSLWLLDFLTSARVAEVEDEA
jgi:hypothetical protein